MDYDTLEIFRKETKASRHLSRFDMWLNDEDTISLNMLEVPADQRRMGNGTAAMEDLVSFADANNVRIVLTPEAYDRYGNRSKRSDARLVRWYKSFGFVVNRGRNKDYRIYDYMYRKATNKEI